MPGTEDAPTDTLVVVADPRDPAALAERLRKAAGDKALPPLVLAHSPQDIDEEARRAQVLFGPPKLAAALVPQLPSLRWVQCTWAGITPLLAPIAAHSNPSIQLTAAKGLFGPRMAEYTFSWLLALERRVHDYDEQQRSRTWRALPSADLEGRRMLLLGTGAIGAHVARVARAFGMRTHGVSRRGQPVEGIEPVYAVDHLHAALGEADYVVASLPDTPATRGLLDAGAFAAMREDAILINVGRGTLVNEQALIDALSAGALRAAVLDVFAQEPLPPEHPFWRTKGLHLTPHVAAVTPEDGICALFVKNLQHYLSEEALTGTVDPLHGY